MELIIERQKRFAEGIERMAKTYESRRSQRETMRIRLLNAVANLNKERNELNKARKDLAVRMAELVEVQAHTDRRLNAIKQARVGKSQT